jgi:hypothetical protein
LPASNNSKSAFPASSATHGLEGSVRNGTLIIVEGTPLPSSGKITSEPFSQGWRIVTNLSGQGLDRHFSQIGWTVFQKAAPVQASILCLAKRRPFLKAFRKILQTIGVKKFNCLEVTSVVKKTVMGVTYVHMSARARNIQKRL